MGADLAGLIRDIPDFPKPGILFKDITPVLADPAGLDAAVDGARRLGPRPRGRRRHRRRGARLPARLGVARELGAGFVLARKPGKLPYTTVRAEYLLEYGTDALELHTDAIDARRRGCSSTTTCSRPAGRPARSSSSSSSSAARSSALRVPARARVPGRPGPPGRRRGAQPARLRRGLDLARRPIARAEGPPQPRARRPARRGVGDRRRPDPARALVAEGRARRGRPTTTASPQVLTTDRGRAVRADFLVLERHEGEVLRWGQEVEGTPFDRILRSAEIDGARHARGRRGAGRRSRSASGCAAWRALGGFIVRRATRRIARRGAGRARGGARHRWPLSRCASGAGATDAAAAGHDALPPHAPGWLAGRLDGPLAGHAEGRAALEDVRLPPSALARGRAPGAGGGGGGGRRPRPTRSPACSTPRASPTPTSLRLRAGEPDGAPDAVVLPADHEQVRAVLEACAREGVAVVPFGGGTSVVGGVDPAARRLRGRRGARPRAAGRRRARRRALADRAGRRGPAGGRARARCSARAA